MREREREREREKYVDYYGHVTMTHNCYFLVDQKSAENIRTMVNSLTLWEY